MRADLAQPTLVIDPKSQFMLTLFQGIVNGKSKGSRVVHISLRTLPIY